MKFEQNPEILFITTVYFNYTVQYEINMCAISEVLETTW